MTLINRNVVRVSLLALIAASIASFALWADARAPRRPSAAVLERGRYLAEHVAACIDCHSGRDFGRYAGPVISGTEGMGGAPFGAELGLPGTFYARNITPAGIGRWTDHELRRAITAGVSRGGDPLFPIMPWPAFQSLCESDYQAIVAYIRTLRPIAHRVPAAEWKIPRPATGGVVAPRLAVKCPERSDTVAYGRYLVTLASCNDCHTPTERGAPVEARRLAGGVELPLPTGGVIRSANLTPDRETGIGNWSRDTFIAKFRTHTAESVPAVAPGELNTYMPWTVYAGMTDDDLGAIYDYLRTVPAVVNPMDRFTP